MVEFRHLCLTVKPSFLIDPEAHGENEIDWIGNHDEDDKEFLQVHPNSSSSTRRLRRSSERRCHRALGPSRAYSQAWMPLLQPSRMSVARQSPVHQDQLSRGQNRGQNRDAEFFYGCSNATTKSANSKAVTRNDRYLAIATCGGLNQQ
ncbi:uncharacterized protein LOC108849839 [Raphanus sativus]|uniref:Uncharacterized protein LOC108849839 n=1 Tax=Raphanus sativus TaxID=3726 RepID=A0A9W3D3X5_RAPSA|nr:uncharacterized protein LOC108849839 [Raphanus sativus]